MSVINKMKLLILLGLFPYYGISQISFVNVTISSGLRAADSMANQSAKDEGFAGPYSWGHRIVWADIDSDELPDLFVGRWPNILLHNNGDGTGVYGDSQWTEKAKLSDDITKAFDFEVERNNKNKDLGY